MQSFATSAKKGDADPGEETRAQFRIRILISPFTGRLQRPLRNGWSFFACGSKVNTK